MTRSRSAVLIEHLAANRKATGRSLEHFVQQLVDIYQGSYADAPGAIEFKTTESKDIKQVYRCVQTNTKRVTRWIDDGVVARIPVDVEESWVQALDEPFRGDCIAELAGRYGLIAVRKPTALNVTDLQSVGDVTKEFGEAIQSMAPLLADGHFDERDVALAGNAITQLDQLENAVVSLREQIRQKTGAGVQS